MQSWSAFTTLLGTAAALKAGVQNHELAVADSSSPELLRAAVDVAGGVTLVAAESYDSYDAYDSYDYAGVYDYTYDSSLGATDATAPRSEDSYDYADAYAYLSDSGLGAAQESTSGSDPKWDYNSFHIGNWPELGYPGYDNCNGRPSDIMIHNDWQSPIDLPSPKDIDETDEKPEFIALDGGCKDVEMPPNNHTFEVEFETKECKNLKVVWKKKTYTMTQFHFHAESENMINLEHYPGEMHMVHVADDGSGSVLVLGVFLERGPVNPTKGKGNTFLTQMFNRGLRNMNHSEDGPVNPYEGVIASNAEFLSYKGSLTTPPCTSNFEWLSILKAITISSDDLIEFKKYLKNEASQVNSYFQNFRPIQPLNNRPFKKGKTPKATPFSKTVDGKVILSSESKVMTVSGPGPLDE